LWIADENRHNSNHGIERIRQGGEDGDGKHLAVGRGSSQYEGKAALQQKGEESIQGEDHHRAADHEASMKPLVAASIYARSAGVPSPTSPRCADCS
jgi:hypothetical protein